MPDSMLAALFGLAVPEGRNLARTRALLIQGGMSLGASPNLSSALLAVQVLGAIPGALVADLGISPSEATLAARRFMLLVASQVEKAEGSELQKKASWFDRVVDWLVR